MLLEGSQWDQVEGPFVAGGEHHRRCRAIVVSSQPVHRCHAPAVAGYESGEPTTTVSVETRHRIGATGLEFTAQHIAIGHGVSIAHRGRTARGRPEPPRMRPGDFGVDGAG